jgi:hypothetical protein
MNDRLSTELSRIRLAHPVLDYLTLQEIFTLSPISKSIRAATQHRRLYHASQRLSEFSAVLDTLNPALEAKEEAPDKSPSDANFKMLAIQLAQPMIAHLNPYIFSRQKTTARITFIIKTSLPEKPAAT